MFKEEKLGQLDSHGEDVVALAMEPSEMGQVTDLYDSLISLDTPDSPKE